MTQPLTAPDLRSALAALPAWTYDPEAKAIARQLRFKTFAEAFAFMTHVALLAEKAGHHPDWSNSYGTVSITLSTHSAGGVTDLDIALAGAIDAAAA